MLKRKQIMLVLCGVGVLLPAVAFSFLQRCRQCPAAPKPEQSGLPIAASARPKVLVVDSYHKGYPWSEGIVKGILQTFKGTLLEDDTIDCSESPVLLRIVRMDTKNNQSEPFKIQAGREVKKVIDDWQPNLVIAADDNAAAYIIVPYFRDTDLPFVFCGVNWDAGPYGFPCRNVTGMIEVDLVDPMIQTMRNYAAGGRIGALGADNESNRKAVDNYIKQVGLTLEEAVFVKNLEELKAAYLDMQKKVDMLILTPPSFLASSESDQAEARRFMLENTTIVTGSVESWIAPYTVFCFSKSPEEQGRWAAASALDILNGTLPSKIPIVKNRQAVLYLNMPLAKKLGLVFPVKMVEHAILVSDQD